MLDPALYNTLAKFRFALRQFLAFSEAATSDVGVTSWQYQALLVVKIHACSGMTIGDLADWMLMRHHGAVQLVDRLVAAGLVERKRSTTDRRKVLVVITENGSKLLEHLVTAHVDELLRQEPLLAESLKQLRQIGR